MQENVGNVERWVRGTVGGALVAAAIGAAVRDRPVAAAALMASGALLLETAVTRVCPVNALLSIDTRRFDERAPKKLPRGKRSSHRPARSPGASA